MTPLRLFRLALLVILALGPWPLRAEQSIDTGLRAESLRALKSACAYYRGQVARHGGYVYYTSVDLKDRWGEGKAPPDVIFVQPPGTPTVGMAYLKAYAATDDAFYLDAARETAEALVRGQLESGGWTQVIDFGKDQAPGRRKGRYRNGTGGNWNVSSLDDGQTQAALQMLVRTDQLLKFHDASIHEAALYGLDALLKAQFPNGAFPQVWTGPVAPRPVVKASFPEYDWKTQGRVDNYWDCYTLNDNLAGTVSDTLITAHETYRDARYKAALEKLADFLILARMPEPQPAWCQQYSFAMVPIWARKFEPPAITGWESQDALETLIKIARYTGKLTYPRARSPRPGVPEKLPLAGRSDRPVLRTQDEQASLHGRRLQADLRKFHRSGSLRMDPACPARIDRDSLRRREQQSPHNAARHGRRRSNPRSGGSSVSLTRRDAGSRPTTASGSLASPDSAPRFATSPALSSAGTSRP